MEKLFARALSVIFHPLIITTLGVLIIFQTNLYITYIAAELKRLIIVITFTSTFLVPAIFIIGGLQLQKMFPKTEKIPSLSIVFLFTAFCFYMGYQITSNLPVAGFFKAIFLAGAIISIGLAIISPRWNISTYTTGTGALLGTTVAVMLRLGYYDLIMLIAILLIGGFSGYSRLVLGKNNPAQVYAGYIWGFLVMFIIFNFL
jgi:hypothetical protein